MKLSSAFFINDNPENFIDWLRGQARQTMNFGLTLPSGQTITGVWVVESHEIQQHGMNLFEVIGVQGSYQFEYKKIKGNDFPLADFTRCQNCRTIGDFGEFVRFDLRKGNQRTDISAECKYQKQTDKDFFTGLLADIAKHWPEARAEIDAAMYGGEPTAAVTKTPAASINQTASESATIESLVAALSTAQRALAILAGQAAGYTSLTIPTNLKIEFEDKQNEVQKLEKQLAEAKQIK